MTSPWEVVNGVGGAAGVAQRVNLIVDGVSYTPEEQDRRAIIALLTRIEQHLAVIAKAASPKPETER